MQIHETAIPEVVLVHEQKLPSSGRALGQPSQCAVRALGMEGHTRDVERRSYGVPAATTATLSEHGE